MATPTRPARSPKTRPRARRVSQPETGYGDAFPNSSKVLVEGPQGVRVPMREIVLSGGEPPLRVYDTSGTLGNNVRQGLPSVRGEWIRSRVRPLPQLHYARRGEITPEMEF